MAESDCNLAIALDGKYWKAYARRGAARCALEKYESALEGDPLLNGSIVYTVMPRLMPSVFP